MAATNTTPKQVQGENVKLKPDCFVMLHLLHPDNELVKESRSMHPSKKYMVWRGGKRNLSPM